MNDTRTHHNATDSDAIHDPLRKAIPAGEAMEHLANRVVALNAELAALREENGRLKEERAYLFDTGNKADGRRPRIIDFAFTAFMRARDPNPEDGGATDWFNDTKPIIDAAIAKWVSHPSLPNSKGEG